MVPSLVVMEAMHYRYHPLIQRLTEVVGELGPVRHIQAWTSFAIVNPGDIRYHYGLAGGAMMDGGCYALDCLRLLGAGAGHGEPSVTGALADLLPTKTVGVVETDEARGLVKIAKPVGVVAALIPTTGPDATPPVKALFALKGRNAIICAPHPRTTGTTEAVVGFMRAACEQVGAPPDLVQSLEAVLPREPRFIGLLGSRRHTGHHLEALRAKGVSEEVIARIQSPVGLDLGAVTPNEIAISILAGLVAVRRRGRGGWKQESSNG